MITEITSSANAVFKSYLSLTESKGLKKKKQFLLSGKNLVQEFLSAPNLKIIGEVFTEGLTPLTAGKSYKLSRALFEELDVMGTHSNLLVVEQPEISAWTSSLNLEGLTVATPLGDPSNLGALLRSAEAFGIKNVILLSESANPFLPKSVKASSGSVTRLHFFKGPGIQEFCQTKMSNLLALDMKGIALQDFQWPSQAILLLGEEGQGLPKNSNMKILSIHTRNVESLNATVAASIALYDYFSKSKH